jgi:hypothetical protein
MSVFGKTSLGNESSYNAGFAFVHYLAQRYGEDILVHISRNLSNFAETTIDGAIEEAVGKSGREIYDEWAQQLKEDYEYRVGPVRKGLHEGRPLTTDGESLVSTSGSEGPETDREGFGISERPEHCCHFMASKGFANLFPSYSPDGKKIAYVSTSEGDYFSQSSLFLIDMETGKELHLVGNVRTAPAWSPDGAKLYYAKSTRENPHWSFQFDIYEYDIREECEERVTHGQRAVSPSISPDGKRMVFVTGRDGSSNLVVANIDGSDATVITPFANGEQVYSPRWSPDGQWIVFDYSVRDGRDVGLVRPDGTDRRFVIAGPDDSRAAIFSADGKGLIFSSDRTGIFNLYSCDLEGAGVTQLTNVLGGAFMPAVSAAGKIVYAGYTSSGYKLFILEQQKPVERNGDTRYIVEPSIAGHERSGPLAMATNGSASPQFDWQGLRDYDDAVLESSTSAPYRSRFTDLNIVPFLRVDNYNPKNTALETVKGGAYLLANDILDKTGFFAGADLNVNLERDLFFNAYYKGKLPLLYQIGLEPTASVELYNVTRKTDNFLTLGADTLPVEVQYDLLEFDFVLNQPFVSRMSSVEFRYIHSRYTSILQSFLLPATGQLVSGSSDLYLIGNDLSLTFRHEAILPSRTSAINPLGRRASLRFGMEFNKFNGDGQYEVNSSGGISPVYKDVDFPRIEFRWKEYLPSFLDGHTINLTLRGGSILGPSTDEFFDFYAGGLPGMKGYPYYSLGGNEYGMMGLAYRFPLLTNIDLRVFNFYFDKLYGTVFADYGDAWTGDVPAFKNFKADAGAESRLESFSFYSFPTRIFFSAAYGFDQFTKYISSQNTVVTYGRDWAFYFGVLFDFEID